MFVRGHMHSDTLEHAILDRLGFPITITADDPAIPIGFLAGTFGSAAQTATLDVYNPWVFQTVKQEQAADGFDDDEAAERVGSRTPLSFAKYTTIAKNGFRLQRKFEQASAGYRKAVSAWRRSHPNPLAVFSGSLSTAFKAVGDHTARRQTLEDDATHCKEQMHDLVREYGLAGVQLIIFFEAEFTQDTAGYERYLKKLHPDYVAALANVYPLIAVPERDRTQHTYVTGGSGSGKSETLKALIHGTLQAVNGAGMIVIDPHGDLAEQIARWSEFATADRLVYVAPTIFPGLTPTINPFEVDGLGPREKDVIAQEIVEALEQLLSGELGGTLSVNMRAVLLPCVLVLLDLPGTTFADLLLFMDDGLNVELIARGRQHPREAVRFFFQNAGTGFKSPHFAKTKSAIAAKLQSLRNTLSFDALVNGPSSLDLEALVHDGKVVVFNLAKGDIGRDASEAVGRFVLAKLQGMALRRQQIPATHRRPVHVFIDECQNYISPATIAIMEETRKYGLHLTLAQQVAGRGMSSEMLKVVLNNTNIKLSGRTKEDQVVAKLFGQPLEVFQQLEPGQFYLQCGTRRPVQIDIRDDLLSDKNAMSDGDWIALLSRMKPYYRSLEQSTEMAVKRPTRQLV